MKFLFISVLFLLSTDTYASHTGPNGMPLEPQPDIECPFFGDWDNIAQSTAALLIKQSVEYYYPRKPNYDQRRAQYDYDAQVIRQNEQELIDEMYEEGAFPLFELDNKSDLDYAARADIRARKKEMQKRIDEEEYNAELALK